jgi:hypothetical protein
MYKSILYSKKRIISCVVYTISMLFFLEGMKFIEYKLNLLPRYSEHPFASLISSFFVILIYIGFLYLVGSIEKKLGQKVDFLFGRSSYLSRTYPNRLCLK